VLLWKLVSCFFTIFPFLFSTLLTFWGHGDVREEYEEDEDMGKPNADRFSFSRA